VARPAINLKCLERLKNNGLQPAGNRPLTSVSSRLTKGFPAHLEIFLPKPWDQRFLFNSYFLSRQFWYASIISAASGD
jgi:hypothetical protein